METAVELLYAIVMVFSNGTEQRVGEFKGKEACEQAIEAKAEQFKELNVTGAYCVVK